MHTLSLALRHLIYLQKLLQRCHIVVLPYFLCFFEAKALANLRMRVLNFRKLLAIPTSILTPIMCICILMYCTVIKILVLL